jgi:UDP-glucose 4-epimerase
MAVNVLSAIHVAEASRRARVKKFVYASTGNVYQRSFAPLAESAPVNRDNWYALSKIHAEEALALFRPELDVTITRLFGVYGPHQHGRLVPNLVRSILEDRDIIVERNPRDAADRNGLRISLCYIDDVVAILRNLDAHAVPLVNVASDEVLSIRDIALAVGARTGREPRLKLAEQTRENDFVADISRLRQLLKPAFTPFTDGIARVVQALPARP